MCKKCKVVKTFDCFVKNKNCKDGYEGICKECKNETRRLRYEKVLKHRTFPESGFKTCRKCKQTKAFHEFNSDLKCIDGRRNICRVCDNKRISNKYHNNKSELNEVYWNRKAESVNKRVYGTLSEKSV